MTKKKLEGASQAFINAVELVRKHRADITEEIKRLSDEAEKLDEMLNQMGIKRPGRPKTKKAAKKAVTKKKATTKPKRTWTEEQKRKQSENMKAWWAAQAQRKKA